MPDVSLRLRLLIATTITMLCALTVVAVPTYLLVENAQLRQVDDAIGRAHTPIEQLASGSRSDWRAIPAVAPGYYVAIIDQNGAVLASWNATEAGREGDNLDFSKIALDERTQTVDSVRGEPIRVRVDPLDRGGRLVVGQTLREVRDTSATLLTALLAASAAAIVVAMLLAWWLVRSGLAPLRRMEASAAAIDDDDLADQRVPGAGDTTEVGRLATTLNSMLDRLDQSRTEREQTLAELVESEARMRRFVADASHELRTPIAATAAYAELFEQGARDRPEDLARSMAGIRLETARMGELVEDLLLLARLDEHRPLARDSVDLTEVVLNAIDAARTVEPDRSFTPDISNVVTVLGDRLRLRQVVDNLLANIRAHTPESAACSVRLSETPDWVELMVSDTGPGVADDDVARLFDRFYRVDDARSRSSGGSGLGLSIVEAIVLAHGGEITATPNKPSGLAVIVRFPHALGAVHIEDVTDMAPTSSSEAEMQVSAYRASARFSP